MGSEHGDAVAQAEALVGWGGPLRMIEARRICGAVDVVTCATRPPERCEASAWSNVPAGSGVGLCWEEALLSTVGEAIERLALFPDPRVAGGIRVARYRDLGGQALDPRVFNYYRDELYGSDGFPAHAFSAEEAIPWYAAQSLRTREERWLPAELVFFSTERVPNHHWPCTTSGVACHRSRERALLGALCELVERDAFVGAWLRCVPLPALDPHSYQDEDIEEILERAGRSGVALHLRDLTGTLEIPTYLAIAEAQDGGAPAIGLGAATHLEGVRAARKALLEALHTWNWALLKIDAQGLASREALLARPLRDFSDHVFLYAHPAMKARVSFLLDAATQNEPRVRPGPPCDDPGAALAALLARLDRAQIDAYAVDQTPAEMLQRGYWVLRAIAPSFLPLQPGRRIQGLRSELLPPDPNPDPHPFP